MLKDIDKFYGELGDLIKIERNRRKISQEELGEILDLTRASIINLEKGRHRPSIYQLILIARHFNMEYTSLIPVSIVSKKEKKKNISADFNNMIIDQEEEIDKSTKTVILDFLSAMKNNN